MPGHDCIVIGASAGGVEALTELVGALPADLPASICIVVHIPATNLSVLPDILSRAGPLPASHPSDGETLESGRIYVAPPNRHLLIDNSAAFGGTHFNNPREISAQVRYRLHY